VAVNAYITIYVFLLQRGTVLLKRNVLISILLLKTLFEKNYLQIKRALYCLWFSGDGVRVDHRGPDITVAKEFLDLPYVVTRCKQMTCE
jgi:hypothetical protein